MSVLASLLADERPSASWTRAAFFAALAVIVVSNVAFLGMDRTIALRIAEEDGPIETLGALASLFASIVLVVCFRRSANAGNRFLFWETRRNVWFLLLAVLMFLCFGEEISWGQRIFGWETPAALQELNAQGEINLHNLWLFHGDNPDGTTKTGFERMLNFSRLYAVFWLAYCVLLPLATRVSGMLARLVAYFGIPVPPLAVGGLFVANFVLFRIIVATNELDSDGVTIFNETKETNYALAFAVLAVYFLARLVPGRPAARHEAIGREDRDPARRGATPTGRGRTVETAGG